MFIFSFIGTIGFSIIGVLFSIFKTKLNSNIVKYLRGFTFGTILILLFLEIIPEPFHEFHHILGDYSIVIVIAIIAAVLGFFYLLHFISDLRPGHFKRKDCESHHIHVDSDKHSLLNSIMFLVSVSLHNIPEGIVLGSAFLTNEINGIIMAIFVFGLHNFVIPYSICETFLKNKISRRRAILLTLFSFVIAYAASIAGYFIGDINELFNAIILSVSAGAILFIVIKELLPSIIKNYDDNIAISIVLGILITIILSLSFGGVH